MRQKQLISPEPPLLDQQIYRFKASFSRIFSIFAIITVLPIFVVEILFAVISTAISRTSPIWNNPILFVLIFIPLHTYFVQRSIDIIVSPVGFVGHNMWGRRIQIDWQDIFLIKSYSSGVFGLRCVSVKSAIYRKTVVNFVSHLYDLSRLLDRVREYAGEDHPFTIVLAKEVSLPRQNPLRGLWQIITITLIFMSIWLIGGNLYADYQEQSLNRVIATYIRQHPKTAPNQSAIDLQALIAKLGISIEKFGDRSKVKANPDKAAIVEWNKIEPSLSSYLLLDSEIAKTEDSFQPLPAKLHIYLNTRQADLDLIQDRLIHNDLPDWGNDPNRIEHSNLEDGDRLSSNNMNYWNLTDIRKLFLARILDRQQSPSPDNTKDLKVIGNLNRSLQNQTLLAAQLASQVNEVKINRLIRRLDIIPDRWEQSLINPERSSMMQAAIERFLMAWNRDIRDPKTLAKGLTINSTGDSIGLAFLTFYHLTKPVTRIIAVSLYQESQQDLAYWLKQDVCNTNGRSRSHTYQVNKNMAGVAIGNLDLELTKGVRQIKSRLGAGQKIDKVASEFKLASQVCPGEQWTAKVKDGAVAISFSHPPNWTMIGMDEKENIDRLTYKLKTNRSQKL